MNVESDRYSLLIDFIKNATEKRGFQYLLTAARILILVGFDEQFVEFYFNNDQFQAYNIRSDVYLKIKEIQFEGKKYFICNFPCIRDINENDEDGKKHYSISKYLAHFLIKQIKLKKSIIYSVINDKNTQQFRRENMDQAHQTFLFKPADDHEQFILTDLSNNIQSLTNPSKLFQTLIQLNNSQKIKLYFQTLNYILPKLGEYLSEITSNLQNLYQNLQLLVQFPKDTENFNKFFHGYLLKLSLQLQTISNKCYCEILDCITVITVEKAQVLNNQIESLQHNNNKPFRLFCQINKKQFHELYIRCNIDRKQFQNLYENYYWAKIPVDWGIQIIIQIKEFILYQAKQIECFEKNDLSYKINSIETIDQQRIQDKNGVFLLGNTQIGKSTFISILENPDNVGKNEDDDGKTVFIKNVENNFTINNSGFSNENRSIQNLELNNYKIYDLPGLNDTYEEFRIINLINISNQLKQFSKPILLLFLNCESKQLFVECFKNTIDILKTLNNNFLNVFESSLIFILSKQRQKSFMNTLNKEEFLQQPDISDLKEEYLTFFRCLEQQRVISFPSASQNYSLENFKSQVLQKLDQVPNQLQNSQNISQGNRSIQFFLSSNNQENLELLKKFVNQSLNFTAQYVCESNIKKILFCFKKSIEKKKSDIAKFQNIISSAKFTSELYQLLQEWCKECEYEISCLDMSEIKKLESFNKITNLSFEVDLININNKLLKMQELITNMQNKKKFYNAVYTATGLILGTVAGGIGLEQLIAKGGQEIMSQMVRRTFFGLGSIALSSFCKNYNYEDYQDNQTYINLYFESNLDSW